MPVFKYDDEVAILPTPGASPDQVFEIAVVGFVGAVLVELSGGRLFYPDDGQSLYGDGWIVPATEEHLAAFRAKLR